MAAVAAATCDDTVGECDVDDEEEVEEMALMGAAGAAAGETGCRTLQRRLLDYLAARPEWRRSGGRDHVVLAHHPNGMLDARYKLWPCVFVLCDFGRYPPSVVGLDKDVIAPYRHVVPNFAGQRLRRLR
ncbi:hypothetical protein OsJ_16298 [Oryza sativa Japonica Group]|uniref:OSJNBa0043L09.6 protein n=3 Tax=Oryza TaxID=4527 RepID=Q7XQU1_ORYSJ|nr:hypothetical protein OsJ_16298 [Oryza sativa Japonica Group]CAE02987.2 OSJNBa0043L09.6 [Oryza sativa Japonica Group]